MLFADVTQTLQELVKRFKWWTIRGLEFLEYGDRITGISLATTNETRGTLFWGQQFPFGAFNLRGFFTSITRVGDASAVGYRILDEVGETHSPQPDTRTRAP